MVLVGAENASETPPTQSRSQTCLKNLKQPWDGVETCGLITRTTGQAHPPPSASSPLSLGPVRPSHSRPSGIGPRAYAPDPSASASVAIGAGEALSYALRFFTVTCLQIARESYTFHTNTEHPGDYGVAHGG